MTTTQLQVQIDNVLEARECLQNPPPDIKRAHTQWTRLEAKLHRHRQGVTIAMEEYNQARRDLLLQWAREHCLGWCSKGQHLAPSADLEELITSGAYVTSGYYEYLRDYTERGTVCRDCRFGLKPRRNGEEYVNYQTCALADPLKSLSLISKSDSLIEQLAKHHDVELPPRMCLEGGWNGTLTLGGEKI